MNVRSQATISYAYALGNVRVKSMTTSNVVSTQIRTVGLLAKKTSSSEFFRPHDVIAYNIIIQNPGNSTANDIIVSEDMKHQKFIDSSLKYSLIDEGKVGVKFRQEENNLILEIPELKGGAVLIISYQTEIEEIDDISVNLKNASNISCREVLPFASNKVSVVQKYAKLTCEKKTVDYTYLDSDICYQLLIRNVCNTEAVDVEIIDQLPFTFELQKTPDAITINKQNADIFVFDRDSHILRLMVDKIDANSNVDILIKGKIVK
jgi:hypothetical protein